MVTKGWAYYWFAFASIPALNLKLVGGYGILEEKSATETGVPLCRASYPSRLGMCKQLRECLGGGGRYQGFCSDNQGVCCLGEHRCGGVTGDTVSYFQNNEFPSPVQDGTLCTHVVKVAQHVCYVRLDFLSFSLNMGTAHPVGKFCTLDWFTIIGSNDGTEQIGTMCGEKAGHSMFIPVSSGQNLILSIAIQSRGQALWDIQATQVACGQVSQQWTNDAQCGISLSHHRTPKYLTFNPESYRYLLNSQKIQTQSLAANPEMANLITGNMFPNPEQEHNQGGHFDPKSLLLKSKGWTEEPKRVNITAQSITNMEMRNDDIEKDKEDYDVEYEELSNDKIGHWNEEKNKFDMFQAYPFLSKQKLTRFKNSTFFKARRGRPRRDHWKKDRSPRMKRASPFDYPWIVKIMLGRQLMCVGTVVHPHFVLTSAKCLLDSSDKANASDVLYIKSWDTERLISFYKIVIHHQWKWYSGEYDLALVQTITPLDSTVCLNNKVYNFTGVNALQAGYKMFPEKVAREIRHLFHQNITIDESTSCGSEDGVENTNMERNFCLKGTDINKWSAGSPLEVSQLDRHYLIGFVSQLATSSCSKESLMTKVSQAISWITAVCTEAVPVRTVS